MDYELPTCLLAQQIHLEWIWTLEDCPKGALQSLPPCLQPQGQALYGVEQGDGAQQKDKQDKSAG